MPGRAAGRVGGGGLGGAANDAEGEFLCEKCDRRFKSHHALSVHFATSAAHKVPFSLPQPQTHPPTHTIHNTHTHTHVCVCVENTFYMHPRTQSAPFFPLARLTVLPLNPYPTLNPNARQLLNPKPYTLNRNPKP